MSGAVSTLMMAIMDQLKLSVVDISPQGMPISCAVTGEELGLSEADEKLVGPLSVSLEVNDHEGTISAAGSVEGMAVRQCVRCLTEFDDPLFVTIYADFVRRAEPQAKPAAPARRIERDKRPHGPEPVEIESDEEDEIYYYQGDQLDLAPMLREQIILAAPLQPLCNEYCAGLCPRCGQNLNDRRCGCAPEPINNPFHVLRDRQGKGKGDMRS